VRSPDPAGWRRPGRSLAAARARKLYDQQAKDRQSKARGDKKSKKAKSLQANLPEAIQGKGDARDKVGEAFKDTTSVKGTEK
jgi:hypothetical protein